MKQKDLRIYIIRPVLKQLGVHSHEAEELLMLVAATETHLGQYLHQINGPAKGIFQMEPRSFKDVKAWCKYRRPEIWAEVEKIVIPEADGFVGNIYRKFYLKLFDPFSADRMVWDLRFAAAMARIYFLRFSEPIPGVGVESLAEYWKQYWNTSIGAGTVEQAIKNYDRYVLYAN